MQEHSFEMLHHALGILLLVLAPMNGWMAYTRYAEHPIMATANATMAAAIIAAVALFWR